MSNRHRDRVDATILTLESSNEVDDEMGPKHRLWTWPDHLWFEHWPGGNHE